MSLFCSIVFRCFDNISFSSESQWKKICKRWIIALRLLFTHICKIRGEKKKEKKKFQKQISNNGGKKGQKNCRDSRHQHPRSAPTAHIRCTQVDEHTCKQKHTRLQSVTKRLLMHDRGGGNSYEVLQCTKKKKSSILQLTSFNYAMAQMPPPPTGIMSSNFFYEFPI